MSQWGISFSPESLKHITNFYGFETLLSPQVQQAMGQGADLIVAQVQSNAMSYFQNPTGNLADHTFKVEQSPYEMQVVNDAPYAHRRDQGFFGADSLGRVYNDRPYLFMTDALTQNESAIFDVLDTAVSNTIGML